MLTQKNGSADKKRIANLAKQICTLKKQGIDVILVSSGAVGAGVKKLNLSRKPTDVPTLQAAAAIGQTALMNTYTQAFEKHDVQIGQILLTHEDIRSRKRFLNARNTITRLLELGLVPVINENDSVAVDEIRFGDNDMLSALVTNLVNADALVILTTVDGLYETFSKDGKKGPLLDIVYRITKEIRDNSTVKTGKLSTGGMATKLDAVKIVIKSGEIAAIANGGKDDILQTILSGANEGTVFVPAPEKMSAKKRWLAYFSKPAGTVSVDAGAEKALREKGKSLLAGGICKVSGNFKFGDTVSVVDENNNEFARGIANYSAAETKLIKGLKTSQIKDALGTKTFDEFIHRNNMVVFAD